MHRRAGESGYGRKMLEVVGNRIGKREIKRVNTAQNQGHYFDPEPIPSSDVLFQSIFI